MTAFPETRAAFGRLQGSWVSLIDALRERRKVDRDLARMVRAAKLGVRGRQLLDLSKDMWLEALDGRPDLLARRGWVRLTPDELTWVAARAGVIDHEAISARPRPDELTAEGLLALRAKLARALQAGAQ